MNEENGDAFGIVWHKEDILSRNESLTAKQVEDVRDYLIHYKDCCYGITWDHIDDAIDEILREVR